MAGVWALMMDRKLGFQMVGKKVGKMVVMMVLMTAVMTVVMMGFE
jgi:hypothetical protein